MKYLSFIILLSLSLGCASSRAQIDQKQVKAEQNVTSFAPTPEENALLWRISGKDLKEDSYLYGTIHMIGKEDFFLTTDTEKAFAEAERVTFEIDMEQMNDVSVMFSLMGQIMMSDGQTLKGLLSETDYNFVKEKFSKLGLPFFMFEKIKPMFLASFAGGDVKPGDMQSGEIKSYEMEFMQMAQAGEKDIAGLETIEFQMSMFDSIPYKAQAEMLVESLKSEDGGDDQFKEMVDMYKNQDIYNMISAFSEEEGGLQGYEDLLLNTRNENWIPIMEGMMHNTKTFFAVGAGHLAGEKGVIALLREKGYKVEPIRTDTK